MVVGCLFFFLRKLATLVNDIDSSVSTHLVDRRHLNQAMFKSSQKINSWIKIIKPIIYTKHSLDSSI